MVSETLARSQLMRALAGRSSRCFTDPAAAEAWLLRDEDAEAETVVPFPWAPVELPYRRAGGC